MAALFNFFFFFILCVFFSQNCGNYRLLYVVEYYSYFNFFYFFTLSNVIIHFWIFRKILKLLNLQKENVNTRKYSIVCL